jgi:hypothetical protein
MGKIAINESTMTNIADALRRKYGETEIITVEAPVEVCRLSSWQQGFDSYTVSINAYGKIDKYTVHTIPNATTIYMKIGTETKTPNAFVEIASGNLTEMPEDAIKLYGEHQINYYIFENTDSITIHFYKPNADTGDGLGYYAEIVGFDADGNPVGDGEIKEAEISIKRMYKSSEMADAIDLITSVPQDLFYFDGECSYLNYQGKWDSFFKACGNKVTLAPTLTTQWMSGSKLEDWTMNAIISTNAFFTDMPNLKTISGNIDINKTSSASFLSNLFRGCKSLRYVPQNSYTIFKNNQNKSMIGLFENCNSLREIPQEIMPYLNGTTCGNMVAGMMCIDAIENFPIHEYYSYNTFPSTFKDVNRLSKFTFATNNGVPYTAEWKSNTLDFSVRVGWLYDTYDVTLTNSGITADKEVTDDASYQALKNDPDWFTYNRAYSRYNHDSAVETINSLPDTSAYLAANGGTNTISFRGDAGSKTDGGAINTLTEEEIAVATVKGWTVTIV